MKMTKATVEYGGWLNVSYDAEKILDLYIGEGGNWFDFWGWLSHAPKYDVMVVLREAAWLCSPTRTYDDWPHEAITHETRPMYLALNELLESLMSNFEYLREMKRDSKQ